MRVAPTKKLTPLFLDFETFWSVDFTLRKIPTGDYVRDDRFKIHCVSAKLGRGKTRSFTDMGKFAEYLNGLDPDGIVLVGHNLYFDGLILTELFGFYAAAYHCTMSMSRGLWRNTAAHGLDALAKRLGLDGKIHGEALVNTKGKETLTKQELKSLCVYCNDDVNDTAEAYWIMLPYMPDVEMEIISHTVRCFVEPLLNINAELLEEAIEEVEQRREELLGRVENFVLAHCPEAESLAKALRSRVHFPRMLEVLGIDPPMKISPRTGKPTYALAAKDPEYMALTEDDDPMVRLICEARSEFTSNQTMTRAQRLLSATTGGTTLPIMYLYCGAHTMRWSASGKMNLQNLQRGSKLRLAIEAPDGYVMMVGDSAQIEARVVGWIAGEEWLLEAFRLNDLKLDKDVYCKFGDQIYGRPIIKDIDDLERFVSKTAVLGLGFGMGWKKFLSTLAVAGINIEPHEAQKIVNLYRSMNSKIAMLWKQLDAVLAAMACGGEGRIELANGELVLEYEADKIWMPNGLALHYPGLRNVFDEEGRHTGYEFLYVKGKTAFWKKIYGGLLCENCLAEGTMVLTDRGWVAIENVRTTDLVHDGIEFVSHGGSVSKSVQDCVSVDGVFMTADHEVLTDEGWKAALEEPRPYRPDLRDIDCGKTYRVKREEDALAVQLRVRKYYGESRRRCNESSNTGTDSQLRVPDFKYSQQVTSDTWNEPASRLCSVAVNAGSLPVTDASSMGKLRWAWDQSMRALAVVSEFLGGRWANIRTRANIGPNRQQQRVQSGQFSVGDTRTTSTQSARLTGIQHSGSVEGNRHPKIDAVLPPVSREVFDIINCGPRTRFVVLGENGPFIVHNCVQCLARIVVSEQIVDIARSYRVVMTTHDEAVMLVKDNPRAIKAGEKFMSSAMAKSPSWCASLPISSEVKHAHNYSK